MTKHGENHFFKTMNMSVLKGNSEAYSKDLDRPFRAHIPAAIITHGVAIR